MRICRRIFITNMMRIIMICIFMIINDMMMIDSMGWPSDSFGCLLFWFDEDKHKEKKYKFAVLCTRFYKSFKGRLQLKILVVFTCASIS